MSCIQSAADSLHEAVYSVVAKICRQINVHFLDKLECILPVHLQTKFVASLRHLLPSPRCSASGEGIVVLGVCVCPCVCLPRRASLTAEPNRISLRGEGHALYPVLYSYKHAVVVEMFNL